MRGPNRWVLLLPFLAFAAGSLLFIRTGKEGQVLFERARQQWRAGNYDASLELYQVLLERFPSNEWAPEALWEIATIYYFNKYDISNSLHYFERLTTEHPSTSWAMESHLRLAEIYEVELNELAKAKEHWEKVLERSEDPGQRLEVRFKIAEASFKENDFGGAEIEYRRIIQEAGHLHVGIQARVREGTILQIKRQDEEALAVFNSVLMESTCRNCRLQAQLGMIESLEHLNRLAEATEVAENISPEDYPEEMKAMLLNRLLEKRKYYEPSLWTGR